MPEQDPVFKLAGVAPDYSACIDLSKTPSPAALHKMKIRHEREKQQKRNRDMESI
ncbi:TPA: septation initiation protein, partial [Klebsiella quasipneumoniae]